MIDKINLTTSTYITNAEKSLNYGSEQILYLGKYFTENNQQFQSRMLIKMPVLAKNYTKIMLKIYAQGSAFQDNDIKIYAYPLTKNWNQGIGKQTPKRLDDTGANWINNLNNSEWTIQGGDFSELIQLQYQLNNTCYVNQFQLTYNLTTVYDDIVDYGLIVLAKDVTGLINCKSCNTKTVFQPHLLCYISDYQYDIHDMHTIDITKSYDLYVQNLKRKYYTQQIIKFSVQLKYNQYTKLWYTTVDNNFAILPQTYYQVVDYITNKVVIPGDKDYTRMSCDGLQNYFILDMNNLHKNRQYKIVIYINDTVNNIKHKLDNKLIFNTI